MITRKALQEIEASLRESLPDDSGKAQLGILLCDELKKTREAMVGAAIPLEVIAGQIRTHGPYTELSRDIQLSILEACLTVHRAMDVHTCEAAARPDDTELAYCDRDDYACADDGKAREYFESACGRSRDHLFKFSLEPNTGEFALSSHLNDQHRGFFRRLWAGLRYAFGFRSKDGHWDRVVLDLPSVERLHRLTNEALDAMQAVAAKKLHD